MHAQLLIDDLVRQTTVLIAQLSTAAGIRAPLSQIADQVFLELSRELEAQGVRRKVVADMFGLALRSYQLKLKRLEDGPDEGTVTLWQEIYEQLSQGSATREALQRRFKAHAPRQIAAILQDMAKSGIAYCSGRGPQTLYGITSESDRNELSRADTSQTVSDMAWYLVASGAATTRQDLERQLKTSRESLDAALDVLQETGRIVDTNGKLEAERFHVRVGAEQGWETAVCDHFRAMATAIGAKVSHPNSAEGDEIGGGTFTFRIDRNHPYADRVYTLLRRVRKDVSDLWQQVSDHNAGDPPSETHDRVTFYFGQNVIETAEDPIVTPAAVPPNTAGESK